jgi:hypothetical protein
MVDTSHEARHRAYELDPLVYSRLIAELNPDFPCVIATREMNSHMTEKAALERQADSVLWMNTEQDEFIQIIEAQTRRDSRKRRSWPYYIAYMHTKYDRQVSLLVLCDDQSVARWARKPIVIGTPGPGCRMTVQLDAIGPGDIRPITDSAQVADDPVLAVTKALIHRHSTTLEKILKVLAEGLHLLDDPARAASLAHYVESGLGTPEARELWRGLMFHDGGPSYTDLRFADGKSEGKAEGRAEGKAEGKAEFVLRALGARRIHVTSAARERILGCDDIRQLERWFDRALEIRFIEELF